MQESQMSPNSNYPIKHTHRIGMDAPFLLFHKTPEQQKAIVLITTNELQQSKNK